MHQVFGKTTTTPARPAGTQPVLPAEVAKTVKALTDETQLYTRDMRTPPAANAATPASTQTQLSAAARTLADILLKHPELPPVLKAVTPLLAAASKEPAHVAQALQRGIGESGLFYESHVARWFAGKLPLSTLAREPQMRGWQPMMQQPLGVAAAGLATKEVAPSAEPEGTDRLSVMPSKASAQDVDEVELERARQQPPLTQELRHSVVRHQLEMLVTPQVRWEGEIWPGWWAAIQLQGPPDHPHQAEADRDAQQSSDDEQTGAWSLRVDTHLPQHGDIVFKMRIVSRSILLTLISTSEPLRRYFTATQHQLREQLQQHGLTEVQLRFEQTEASLHDNEAAQG